MVISLGGNMGDREYYLREARNRLADSLGPFSRVSSLYETEAWGIKEQASFLNQVGLLYTKRSAPEALGIMQKVEASLGRIREQKWSARTIDLDILYYAAQVIHTDDLQVPHPFIAQRRFILVPLAEICPDWIHPLLKLSQKDLLEACEDEGLVYKWKEV